MGMTVRGVESRLEKAIKPFFDEKKFIKTSELVFEKEVSQGTFFRVSFNIKGYEYNDFSVQAIFGICIHRIEDYWIQYRGIVEDERNPYPLIIGFLKTYLNPELDKKHHTNFGEAREPIRKEEDIQIYVNQFKREYNELIIPFVRNAIEIEWLDKQLNEDYMNFKLTPPFQPRNIIYKKLIVAKLNNNPKFEEMYQAFRVKRTSYLEKNEDENVRNSLVVLDNVYSDLSSTNFT